MSAFDIAIEAVLKHEGLFVDHPHDPGGATNYGVSLRWLRSLGDTDLDGYVDGDLDHDGDVDADDIKQMTRAQAIELYRTRWWRPEYDQIQSVPLAAKLFDTAINVGAAQAAKILQRAANQLAPDSKRVAVDGVLGAKTLGLVAAIAVAPLLAAYRSEQARFYLELVDAQPTTRSTFLRGWLRRALT